MKRQSTDTNIKMNLIFRLPKKNYKATIIKMIQQAITNSLEINESMENLRKIMKILKKEHN